MRTAAVLPIKRFAAGKQRLAPTVGEEHRRALVEAMLRDVLDALAGTPAITLTILVSAQPALADVEAADVLLLEDSAEAGQSAAATIGIQRALADGFERVLCVPGDCPALEPSELQRLLVAADPTREEQPGARVVGIPDRHGSGTNALLMSPPDAITPSFGPDSFARHRDLALAAGAAWRVERPSSLLLDIDTGADLQVLREWLAGSGARAARTRAALANGAS